MKISQSMLRTFQEYLSGTECGLVFEAKYINYNYPDSTTEAQAAGQWFEYVCTGATPRNNGTPPEPVRIKSGDFNALYRQLGAHRTNWELIANPLTEQYGVIINAEIDGVKLTGITDVFAPDYTGDIKTTGHINNKWEPYGWGGDLQQKPSMFQAKFYTLIRFIQTGKIIPFYFYVFSSSSDDWDIIRVTLSETALELFKDEVMFLVSQLEYHTSIGFDALPDYQRCGKCQLKDTCKSFTNIPKIKEVIY